ncbi:MAG: hypothetical protein ACYDAW_09790 [Acidithiobacillus ferrivorans]
MPTGRGLQLYAEIALRQVQETLKAFDQKQPCTDPSAPTPRKGWRRWFGKAPK